MPSSDGHTAKAAETKTMVIWYLVKADCRPLTLSAVRLRQFHRYVAFGDLFDVVRRRTA